MHKSMKVALIAMLTLLPAVFVAQTTDELNNDGKNTDNVDDTEHGPRPQELQPAQADQQVECQKV